MTEQINSKQPVWTLMIKFLQLFVLTYFFFYMFPFPLTDIPVIGDILSYYDNAIEFLTIWLGENVLRLDKVERIEMTGSGDTTFDFVKLLTTITLSFCIATIIFSFTATKSNYKRLTDIVFTYARYYLALYLLSYGFAKFYDGQFVFPDINRLEQKFGDASPMGLLWTFMGYSKAYTVFSGVCEVVGGLLLFFRRTTVLGGLISFMVMTNVAMLNFAYDVPVKLFSTHLALISIFIISPNILKLFQFFFLNKTATLNIDTIELQNKWLKYGRVAFKALIVIGFPALFIISDLSYSEDEPKHNLNGAYITEQFIINNDTISSTQKDSAGWSKFFITDYYAKVVFNNDKKIYYKTSVDTSLQTLSLSPYSDTTISYNLKYSFINEKAFTVSGQFRSDSISATFNVKRPDDYELVKRKFNWINEYPYNR